MDSVTTKVSVICGHFDFGHPVYFHVSIVRRISGIYPIEGLGKKPQIVQTADRVHTPAGTWTQCVTLVAYTKHRWLDLIAPNEYRTYAPGIGLVQQQDMKLVRYGYIQ